MALRSKVRGAGGLRDLSTRLRQLARDAPRLHGTKLVMAIRPDEKGFIDRECPRCHGVFKVHETGLADHTGNLTCPYHAHTAPGDQWTARSHRDHARNQATRLASNWIRGTLRGEAPTGGLGELARDARGHRELKILPPQALALLEQERQCGRCRCRFAFIGAAFFCPLCGDNSADATFDQTLGGIRRRMRALHELTRNVDRDTSAEVARILRETSIQDIVTAFQRVGELLYAQVAGAQPPLNAFQRLGGGNDGNTLWEASTGRTYASYITDDEFARVVLYFQLRHCLAHCDGIVDRRYLDRSGDRTYEAGQRLRVTAEDVLRFADLAERLVTGMRLTRDHICGPRVIE